MDQQAAIRQALREAAEFLAANGVNPADAEVLEASLDYRDELLLEPNTLVDHGTTFSQIARVTFAGPRGQPIPVEFRTLLESSSMFP